MSVDLNNAYSGRGASSRQSAKNDDAFDDFFKNSLQSQASLGQPEFALDDGGQQDRAREIKPADTASNPQVSPSIPDVQQAAGVKEIELPAELDFQPAGGGAPVHLKATWVRAVGVYYVYNQQKNSYEMSPVSNIIYVDKEGNPYAVNKFERDLRYDGFDMLELDPLAPKGAEKQIRSIVSLIKVVNLTTGKVLEQGQPTPPDVAQAGPAPTSWQNFKTWVDEKLGPAYPDGVTERYLKEIDQAPSSTRYRAARMVQGVVDIPRVVEIPWHIAGYLGGVDTSDPDVRAMALMSACPAGTSDACHNYLLYDMASQGLWNKTSGGVPHRLSRELSVNNFMGDVPWMAATVPFSLMRAGKMVEIIEGIQDENAAAAAAAAGKTPKPPAPPSAPPPTAPAAPGRIALFVKDKVDELKIAARNITGKISDAVTPGRQPELATPNGAPSLGRSPLDKIPDGMHMAGKPKQPMTPMKIDEIYDHVAGSGVRNLQGSTAAQLESMNIGYLLRNFEADLAMLKRLRLTTNLPDETAAAMGLDDIKAMVPAIESRIKQLVALAGDIKSGTAPATAYGELAAGLGQVNSEMQNLEAALQKWEAFFQYAQTHGMLEQPGPAANAAPKPEAAPSLYETPMDVNRSGGGNANADLGNVGRTPESYRLVEESLGRSSAENLPATTAAPKPVAAPAKPPASNVGGREVIEDALGRHGVSSNPAPITVKPPAAEAQAPLAPTVPEAYQAYDAARAEANAGLAHHAIGQQLKAGIIQGDANQLAKIIYDRGGNLSPEDLQNITAGTLGRLRGCGKRIYLPSSREVQNDLISSAAKQFRGLTFKQSDADLFRFYQMAVHPNDAPAAERAYYQMIEATGGGRWQAGYATPHDSPQHPGRMTLKVPPPSAQQPAAPSPLRYLSREDLNSMDKELGGTASATDVPPPSSVSSPVTRTASPAEAPPPETPPVQHIPYKAPRETSVIRSSHRAPSTTRVAPNLRLAAGEHSEVPTPAPQVPRSIRIIKKADRIRASSDSPAPASASSSRVPKIPAPELRSDPLARARVVLGGDENGAGAADPAASASPGAAKTPAPAIEVGEPIKIELTKAGDHPDVSSLLKAYKQARAENNKGLVTNTNYSTVHEATDTHGRTLSQLILQKRGQVTPDELNTIVANTASELQELAKTRELYLPSAGEIREALIRKAVSDLHAFNGQEANGLVHTFVEQAVHPGAKPDVIEQTYTRLVQSANGAASSKVEKFSKPYRSKMNPRRGHRDFDHL
jgi:hypothetical protein